MIVQIFARDFQGLPRMNRMVPSLTKEGYSVAKLLYSKLNSTEKEIVEGKEVITMRVHGFKILDSGLPNQIRMGKLLNFGIFGGAAIKKLDKKEKIEILHCHRHSALIPAFAAKLLGVNAKIILDYHDPWSGESTFNEEEGLDISRKMKIAIFRMFEKISLKFINHVIVVSDPQEKLLKSRYGLKSKMFTKITNSAAGYDDDAFNPKRKDKKRFGWQDKKVVVFTGAIVQYFGLDLLINSIPLVAKKIPNILFVIKIAEEIKEKEFYNKLKEKIKEYGIEKNVKFVDEWMNEEKYSAFISSADAGIICHKHTLLTETADPDKLYEYLAAGLPIIATNLEIMKNFVKNGENGYIAELNPKSISDAVVKVLENESKRKNMSDVSRKMRFDWKDDVSKLLKTYKKILNGNIK